MGSRIYTRSGDAGQTSLLSGQRVGKDSARVEAYGTVDEACSYVGAARAFCTDELLDRTLLFVGHRLYNCSSCLAAAPGTDCRVSAPAPQDTEFLERAVDAFEERTGSLGSFVLPGGCRAASLLHVARTVTRRAERRVVELSRIEPVDEAILRFLNRTSDLLFAAARYANHVEGLADPAWDPSSPQPSLD